MLVGSLFACKSVNRSNADLSAIIGDDDRSVLTDPRALEIIGTITLRGKPICTAFVSGPSQVATASHCIDYARIDIGSYGFRRANGEDIKISKIVKRRSQADIIVLEVDHKFVESLFAGKFLPADRVETWSYDPTREQFFSQKKCSAALLPNSQAFRHSCDTVGGSSGSPVISNDVLVGIHVGYLKSVDMNLAVSASQLTNLNVSPLDVNYVQEIQAKSLTVIARLPSTLVIAPIISPVVESSARGAAKAGSEEIEAATNRIVDTRLVPLVDRIDFAATKLVDKVNTTILGGTVIDVERELGTEIRASSEIVGDVIRKTVAASMIEARKTVGGVDHVLERRIKQVGIIVAKMSDQIVEVTNNFTPERLQNILVNPTIAAISALESQVINDVNEILNRVDCSVRTAKEDVAKEIRGYTDFGFHLFDKCRKLIGANDQEYIQDYLYAKCKIFGNISSSGEIIGGEVNENTEISKILVAYARINSWVPKMRCLEKDNSLFLELIDKDYISYLSSFHYWKNREDI
jgi:V8-like Glu-specific endopeptidase